MRSFLVFEACMKAMGTERHSSPVKSCPLRDVPNCFAIRELAQRFKIMAAHCTKLSR